MSPAPAQLPEVGDLIAGRYRIIRELGRGGYGVVYQARQEAIARDVALKFLHPEVAHNEREVERFRREVFHASGLHHRHTITLFDYGQTPRGLLYVAMELLIGENLRERVLRRGPVSLEQGNQLLEQLLGSLEEAHERQLVHRDLKPENIFLCDTPPGAPLDIKVLDFGLSKFIGDPGATLYRGPSLTADGEVCGTPQYMSPEHAYGEPVGPPGDVYAVGLVLYEALIGKPAFDGPNPMDILLKQVKEPLPALPEEIATTALGRFIERATRKEVRGRFADARSALSWFLARESPGEQTPGSQPALARLARSAPSAGLQDSESLPGTEPTNPAPPDLPLNPFAPTERDLAPRAPEQPSPEPHPEAAPSAPTPRSALAEFDLRAAQLPLLGRHAALDALERWYESAALNGGLFVISGESGQGKSTLVETWQLRQQATQPALPLFGQCRRRGAPLEALRRAFEPLTDARRSAEPTLGQRLHEALDALASSSQNTSAYAATAVIHPLHQVIHALFRFSERSALLLILEDVHYADPLSRRLIDQLLENLSQQPRPIALVFTARSQRHVARWLQSGAARVAHHHLDRLPDATMGELLHRLAPPAGGLERDLLDLAGGNPALLIHIVRHLLETEQLQASERSGVFDLQDPSVALSSLVPPDLQQLVITRAERLLRDHPQEPRLRALLHRVVLFGDRFKAATLARAIHADGQPELATHIGPLLEMFHEVGLLRREGNTDDSPHYAFVQPLHRASLLRMVESIDDWRAFHNHAARALIEAEPSPDAAHCEAVAEHLERSAQRERALPWWLRAAAEAECEHRVHEALRLLRRAEPQIIGTRNIDHASLSALRLQQGRLYHQAGEFGPAEDALREAISHAESADHVANEAQAREHLAEIVRLQGHLDEAEALLTRTSELCVVLDDRAGLRRVLLGQADLARFRGRYDRARHDLEMVRQAAHLEGDPGAEVDATLALSRCAYASGELRQAWSLVGEALDLAQRIGDHRAHALALIEASQICMIVDGLERSEALARQAMNAARHYGDVLAMANANLSLALCFRRSTHLDRSADHLRRARELHERLGHLYGVAKDLLLEAELHWLRGDIDRARQLADDAVKLHEDLDDRHGWALSTIFRALFRIEGGQPDRAIEFLNDVIGLQEHLGLGLYGPQLNFYLGMALEAQANIDAALNHYIKAQQQARSMGHREMISLSTISIVKLKLILGDFDDAREEIPEATRQAERTGHAYANMFALLGTALLAHIDQDSPLLREALARLRPYIHVPHAPDLRLDQRLGGMQRLLDTLPETLERQQLRRALTEIIASLSTR
ncbi:protein kinase [Lujinxingia vulgaris]|uniref:Protein kinase n=1 Tax=Lujinxingia vulgaris TaxID=2600176 RepID=A0A5C6X0E6_9DELT|nr:serine/threonine-protein kinase [Lujinxingia vulgaris]TXD35311.1 protein kinase [Lujinxingia vulgaris]